jgi:hypothetical protein
MTALADAVLVLHALLVVFIVGGLVAIWVGGARKRSWARNRVFRFVHLTAISIVAGLAVLDVPCPLTVLEDPRFWRREPPPGLAALRIFWSLYLETQSSFL